MTGWLVACAAIAAGGLVAAGRLRGWPRVRPRRAASGPRGADRPPAPGDDRRILLPFVAHALSGRALDAALRLARAEQATIVPVFLARVTLDLPLDAPVPRQCATALPLQEAIEQQAAQFGIPVDARIERGRSNRHALGRAIAGERYDRVVIAAANRRHPGFTADDIAWLLDHAPGEVVVVRPADSPPSAIPSAEQSWRSALTGQSVPIRSGGQSGCRNVR